MQGVPAPMLATSGPAPSVLGREWAAEMKWDGLRAISRISSEGVRFFSRNGRDITAGYPELAEALLGATTLRGLVLDGEIVAPGPGGAPLFGRLQRRMHVERPTQALISEVRVQYFIFDLLVLDGGSVMNRPYLERRELLESLALDGDAIRVPPTWLDADLDQLLQAAQANGLEGVVLKQTGSTYTPGRRSPAWRKFPLRRSTDAVIVGFTPGSGSNSSTFGSLVLAAHDRENHLRWMGAVGTGFSRVWRQQLYTVLTRIQRESPPVAVPIPTAVMNSTTWVDPILVALVEYRELTEDGVLRQPSFIGLHSDRLPETVESPAPQ
ncbi:non-homologous end-joining DNA ligase [Nocardia sp. NPDC101769]|uniref:non-homologous end-joining DNA ligase n=1 Tax=Nocardia sp. NPDC101769 TaxID=3364333 RepID=UPI003806E61B